MTTRHNQPIVMTAKNRSEVAPTEMNEQTAQGHVTGWRPRGAEAIVVCEKCGIVCPPDRDGCPNSKDFLDREHVLGTYIARTAADTDARERRIAEQRAVIAFQSIEAAQSVLDAAKAAIR